MPTEKSSRSVFIHPTAQVDPQTPIGAGTRIWQFSVVKKGSRIGKNCNIGAHCYIEWGARLGRDVTVKNDVAVWEGVSLGDGVFVGPNAVFTNDLYPRSPRLPEARHRYRRIESVIVKTRVGRGATLGAGAMILAGASIGRFATVGMGSVVTRPVAPYALVAGNPARRVGWICECGLPLPGGPKAVLRCAGCKKRYAQQGGRLRKLR